MKSYRPRKVDSSIKVVILQQLTRQQLVFYPQLLSDYGVEVSNTSEPSPPTPHNVKF